MGSGATPETEPSRDLKTVHSLPKHSYWFDFWVFVLIDVALFFVVYFMVP
uniref:Uncharacterized protein n=1 Tax=Mastacembelus armatus TaxID=205130 RepID=A0A3Q3T2J3_9TELE